MISPGLALAFGLEAVLYLLACLWLWQVSVIGFPIGMIIVLLVTALILLRVMMPLVAFVFAYVWRTPRPPDAKVGPLGGLRLVLADLLAFLVLVSLLIPFSRRLVTMRRGSVSIGSYYPVLLVHGYGMNAGVWAPMVNYLRRRGLGNVFTLNLYPKFGDIDDFAQQLAARVNRICDTTRAGKVILIGHSMGGLVARAYVERFGGGDRVVKVIYVGTPHHGSRLARLAPGVNAHQMCVGSEWLLNLNRDENQPSRIKHVSIFSVHDNVVVPQNSGEFGKAKNIRVVGKGHFAMLFSREVGQLVYREITAL